MRKVILFIPFMLLIVIEWLFDMISKIINIIHLGFKDMDIAIESEYKLKPKANEPDIRKV